MFFPSSAAGKFPRCLCDSCRERGSYLWRSAREIRNYLAWFLKCCSSLTEFRIKSRREQSWCSWFLGLGLLNPKILLEHPSKPRRVGCVASIYWCRRCERVFFATKIGGHGNRGWNPQLATLDHVQLQSRRLTHDYTVSVIWSRIFGTKLSTSFWSTYLWRMERKLKLIVYKRLIRLKLWNVAEWIIKQECAAVVLLSQRLWQSKLAREDSAKHTTVHCAKFQF